LGRRKRGWHAASSLSLGDLRRLYEAKESQISKLAARRDAVAAELAAVEGELAAAGGGGMPAKRGPGRPPKAAKMGRGPGRPKGSGKRRGRKPGAKGQSDLHNAIRSALKSAGEPMKLADLAKKVVSGGYKTKSSHFPMIVGMRLTEMKDVKKAGRGLYAMR
jgi:hypothetical protein